MNDATTGAVMCDATSDGVRLSRLFTTTADNMCYFAVVPGLTDTCLKNSCPGHDGRCSLHVAQTQEQRQTPVSSHELSGMFSDPQLNAWTDPVNGENGDVCNGQSTTITVGPNTWTVQTWRK